jgi:hypothetical protein
MSEIALGDQSQFCEDIDRIRGARVSQTARRNIQDFRSPKANQVAGFIAIYLRDPFRID